jgi:hypothetical protein
MTIMADQYSLSAKLFMVSGKMPGLNEGLSFYDTPTGEKVNSRTLASYLIAATIEDLSKKGLLEYRLEEMKVIGGKLPLIVLKRKGTQAIGFEKLLLDNLDKEMNLIDLVKKIIGGMYQMPENQLLWLIRSEFDVKELMRKEKVTMLFVFSRMETRWIPEKVQPFVDEWLNELKPVWGETLELPWLKTAVRNCNFAYSHSKVQTDTDDDKD